jgi:hypothetical protein
MRPKPTKVKANPVGAGTDDGVVIHNPNVWSSPVSA